MRSYLVIPGGWMLITLSWIFIIAFSFFNASSPNIASQFLRLAASGTMLVYLWGVGCQERQQRQSDSYGCAPYSSGVRTSPSALRRLRRGAGRWRNGAGTLAVLWSHPASFRNGWRPDPWCWRWAYPKSFLMCIEGSLFFISLYIEKDSCFICHR